ncbi:MAG: hypothetical protein ACP5IB_05685 [Thermoplasmata archaeon]
MKDVYLKRKGILQRKSLILIFAIIIVIVLVVLAILNFWIVAYYSFPPPLLLGMMENTNSTTNIFTISYGNITVSPSNPFIIKISPPSGNNVTFILQQVATPINNTLITNTLSGEKIYYTIWVHSISGNKYLTHNDTICISQKIGNISNPYTPLSTGTNVTFIYKNNVIIIYHT